MVNQRARIFAVSLPVALMIIVQTLAVFPSKATAQCPTMSAEGATFGITQFNTVKSQMWYNDGVWWGVFSDLNTGIHFYSFPNNSAVQGPIFDATITGIPDALWDGTNLYVMVWKSVSLATFYKFTYNSVTKTHSLISGFPINIPLNGSSTAALVIEKDSTGKIWATYTGTQGGLSDGKIRVIWTTSADHKVWDTTGTSLESGLTPNTLEISTIARFGGNKIGVAWSNQPGKEIAFRYHIDGQAEATWSTKEIIDSGIGPRGLGPVADDHLAMKGAPDGRIFLVAKDNDNDGTPAHATEGRIWLYIRTTAGTWGQKTIIQPDFSQLPTRPVILMDTFNNRLYVIYHDDSLSGSGRNFIANTSMDSPFFDFPCVFNVTSSSNPTSTKQYVNPTTGIMAIASTGSTGSGELVFRSVSLPSDNPVPTAVSLTPSSGLVGGSAFTLTVNGTNFINGSVVRWNGNDRLTSFVSSTQLTASILASDIMFAGNANVTVFTGTPGGGQSNEVAFTINNPLPSLSSIAPTSKTAGNPAFILTVNGTNFLNTSVVRFNGTDRPTTFVNSTQLTAQITATDIQAGGTFPIRVFTAGPGGGLSSNIDLTVLNPIPTLNSISPTIKTMGDPAFTITIDGTNFINGSIVRFNGSNRTTTFFGSTQLTAQLTAADVQTAGTYPITVFNPTPGGGTSNAVNLTVNNPLPALSSISPNSKTAGDPAFTLTVNGTSFINGSVVRFNGSDRTTTFVNSTQLTAQITAADVQAAGSFAITVFNPTPGGGVSSAINLTVANSNYPIPALASMSPTSKTSGDPAFTLTVNGSNFVAASVVLWNGQPRTTSFVNAAQLTAQIAAADVAAQGSASVTVFTPAPGGGTSGPLSFTINPPVSTGYESDVAPRPNGSNNGTITISDWVQTGRFSAGLDVPSVGSEFQRADSAPKSSFGNGLITVSDWVQAGRYAAGLDPVAPVGGPTGPLSAAEILDSKVNLIPDEAAAERIIRIAGTSFNAGQAGSVAIELDSQGDENALGLSVTFDPTKLTLIPPAIPGTGAAGTVMNVNYSAAGAGRVGIAISQPAGLPFAAGTRQLVVLNFNVAANASGSTVIGFGDSPIAREVVGVAAEELAATFNGATLNIITPSNPVPAITTINPTSAAVGGAGFTLTVNGSNFISGSVVRWNGIDRPTTFVNSNQLTAQISAADLQSATTAAITVSNPSPAGGVSNIVNLDVTNPSPSVSSLAPASAVSGGAAFTLTVNGSNFVNGSVIAWNGDTRITTFVSSTQLTAQITATDILTAGTAVVTVTTSGPGGGVSGSLSFSVNNPSPSLTGLAPASVVAGGTAFTLTVSGDNFVNGAVVRLNGADRATTFVSNTQLTAQISAADILMAGSASITVSNPSPGGGASGSLSLAVNNPGPSLNSLAPASAVAGGAAFTLTVNGSNFVNGAVVRWNGSDRPTTFVNSAQLTAQISAADISAATSAAVTVFNPSPGGGLSSVITFSIIPSLQFSAASFSISEDGGSAVISITRTGDTSAAATVDFGIADPVGYVPCHIVNNGQVAAQNCDYTISAATLRFAAGETTKNATIPIINDAYAEGSELLNLKLSNALGASLGAQNTAVLTIMDNDSGPPMVNPIDETELFVRQQYLDFLGREPDQGGLAFWKNEIDSCNGDQLCIHARRIRVADAFFFEPEFQETGAYVYRIYRAGLGVTPTYAQFQPDRALVLGGANLDQSKTAFALNFVQRLAFLQTHGPAQSAEQFVDQILLGIFQNSHVNLSDSRDSLLALYDGTDNGRAAILRQVANNPLFIDAEYNRSFVLNEYFGYLRRDPDQGGYDFWLGQVNGFPLRDENVQHAMVCSFITSFEYQNRFSSLFTTSNDECPQ